MGAGGGKGVEGTKGTESICQDTLARLFFFSLLPPHIFAFHPNPSSSRNLPSLPALPKRKEPFPFVAQSTLFRVLLVKGGQGRLPSRSLPVLSKLH